MAFKSTTHGNKRINIGKSIFVLLNQSGQIRHWSQCNHRDGFFFQNISQKVYSTPILMEAWNFWQKDFSQSIFPMGIQGIYIVPF